MFSFKPQNVFLFFSLIFGTLFIFLTPPFQAADEFAHFFRAYQISEGNFFARKMNHQVGDFLPASLNKTTLPFGAIPFHPENKADRKEIFSLLHLPLAPHNRTFLDFRNTALYPPPTYLPQAIGIAAGRVFQLSPLILMYGARLFNFSVWTLLVFIAVKTSPVGKWLFAFLSLTPMSLFQAASVSADTFTNGISLLLVSFLLKLKSDPVDTVGKKELGILALLSFLLSVSKPGYLCLALLFFLIPRRKFIAPLGFFKSFVLVFTPGFLASLAWSLHGKGVFIPLRPIPNIFPDEQLHLILSHPAVFFSAIGNTIVSDFKFWAEQYVGGLGWLDVRLSWFAPALLFFFLIFTALTDENPSFSFSWKDKALLFFVITLNLLFIFFVQYLTFNAVGSDRIDAFYGRYLVPLAPPAFLLLYNHRVEAAFGEKFLLPWVLPLVTLVLLGDTVLALSNRYY